VVSSAERKFIRFFRAGNLAVQGEEEARLTWLLLWQRARRLRF